LENQVNHAKVVVGLILLGYGLLSGLVLSMLLGHVFGRLHKLGTKMEQIQGNISYVSSIEKGDEVTILEHQYNGMIEKLEHVIDEMVEVKSQKQKFEFKSLESQINPHFLYNTLGVMRWEAIDCDNSKLVNMIDNLTTFYRLSLNRGKGVLNIEQELKLVKAYIDIQQMRWDNVVEVEYRVDANLEKILVPKMILQPLVENIWLHGNITAESNRKIKILVQDADAYVIFKIWDNGDGIEKEVLETFKNKSLAEDSFGIGIQFIRNILTYYYENDFKYEVVSKTNMGTLVRLTLPKKLGS
jgi:two-component system sensor histidine kinase YesM